MTAITFLNEVDAPDMEAIKKRAKSWITDHFNCTDIMYYDELVNSFMKAVLGKNNI